VEEGTAGEHGDFAEMVVSQNRSLYQPWARASTYPLDFSMSEE
jgi:hypothetical protein